MLVKILSLQYEKQRRNETMGKLLLTGVDGNLGETAAEILLTLEPKENLIFCGYSEEALKKYADMGVETRQTNFNNADGLSEAFKGADALALISMPFVGAKRQKAHKNAIDAAKAAGVKQIIYTSLVNADDETNPSVEKKDHLYRKLYKRGRLRLSVYEKFTVCRGDGHKLLYLCKNGNSAHKFTGRRIDGLYLQKRLCEGCGIRAPQIGRVYTESLGH